MARASVFRHVAALALGVAATALGVFALDVHVLVSVGVGALVYGGSLLLTVPANRFKALPRSKELGEAPDFVVAELERTRERIRTIRKIRGRMPVSAVADSVGAIADSADAIIADLNRNPRDYRRLRKALVHYLPHVETIAERYAYVQEAGSVDPEMRGRAEQTLADMQRLFVEYQRRMLADETFDLDTRIALLEQEVRREGVAASGMGPSRSTTK